MVDDFIRLPDDSANLGKKVRTQTRTVLGHEVHEHMFNLVDPIPAGDNLIGRVKVSDGTTVATVRDLAANDALNVAIVDGSGNQVTSFGGTSGTQYVEDATVVGATGNVILWKDASNVVRSVSATKPLPVDIKNTVLTVQATDLDIRNLDSSTDSVLVVGVVSISGSVTVTATNLDIRDLTFAADKVDASGSTVTISGTVAISAVSLPLPSGAATAAKQDTGNSSLASIDGKIPASPSTDRATAGGPFSVRLSDGSAFYKATTPADTQPVSIAGTVSVSATDLDIRNLVKTQDEVYSVLRTDAGAVYDARTRSWTLSSATDSVTAVAAATAPIFTRPSDGTNAITNTADLDTGAGTATRVVSGLLGAASGGPVIIGGTSGGALKTDLSSVGGTSIILGQANMADSIPVAIAANQSGIDVVLPADLTDDDSIYSGLPVLHSGVYNIDQGLWHAIFSDSNYNLFTRSILPCYNVGGSISTTGVAVTSDLTAGLTQRWNGGYGSWFAIKVTEVGGVATSWTVKVQTSIDEGGTWDDLLTHSKVTPGNGVILRNTTASPAMQVRVNCTALNLGGGGGASSLSFALLVTEL